ncbi:MAG: glycosyltransferase [Butyrivibrio sp.]|nr:glycosyltransferase [Butyrivibrio sp.]
MNIVYCRYRNVCEPDYIDAFKALGINVVECFINEMGVSSLDEKAQKLGEIFARSTPMFVFSINYFPYISIVCQGLGIKYVSISVTCPMVEIYNTTIRNSCNRVFLFDHEQYLSVRDENPEGIFYLPLGAGVSRMDTAVGELEEERYLYDVSFVGSLYNEKDPFLELKLSDADKERYENLIREQIELTASGQDFLEKKVTSEDVEKIKSGAKDFYPSDLSVRNIDDFVAVNNYLSPHMTYLERVKILNFLAEDGGVKVDLFTKSDTSELKGVTCHGGVESLKGMPQVFYQSRINLNLSTRSIKTGIPQRVWDVLGSGGFLITNDQKELADFFEIGKHLVAYKSLDELKELVHYYLEHEEEREAIAAEGYELVKSQGTVFMRVLDMIKNIG